MKTFITIIMLFICANIYAQQPPFINMSKTDIFKIIKPESVSVFSNTSNNIEVKNRDFKQIFYIKNDICYRYDIVFDNINLFNQFKNTYNPNDSVYVTNSIKFIIFDYKIVYTTN